MMHKRSTGNLSCASSSADIQIPTGLSYLSSLPGVIRAANVVLGLLTLILCLLGFPDDYSSEFLQERYERRQLPWYRLVGDGSNSYSEYYGVGYVSEHPNILQLVCIGVSLVFSAVFLLCLVISPMCHFQNRGWNRFLNLTAAILQAVGVLSGVFGVLLLRSYCCHVEFVGMERLMSEQEGYRRPCLCYFTPLWQDNTPASIQYTSLYFNDIPGDIIFHSALPHHFIPHVIALILMVMNMTAYMLATMKI